MNESGAPGLKCAQVASVLLACLLQSSAQESGERISLRDCVVQSLVNNRTLQIERLNVPIARFTLSSAYGYYDPVLFTHFRKENSTDIGGYDPADFSRDTTYDADSEVGSAGLTGVLPMGMSYSLGGSYAHSDGVRNTTNVFESYKLGVMASVQQPLLKNFWTDLGRTTIAVNRKTLTMTELAVQFWVMVTVQQTEHAYYEWLFARENLQVFQRIRQAREETFQGIKRQVEVGQRTVVDERLAASDLARIEEALIVASNSVQLAENTLRMVLGQQKDQWSKALPKPADALLVVPQTLDLSSSWKKGLDQRPDLAQLEQDVERSNLNLRYRYNQLFPSLDLIAAYGRRGASPIGNPTTNNAIASLSDAMDQIGDGDAPSDMVGVVLTVPLSRKAERNNYQVGKLLKEQAQLRVKQKEEMVIKEVADAFHQAESAFQRVAASRRAREAARAALEAEQEKMETGKSSVFFVLSLQGDLAQAESAEVRARADYNQALSQLRLAEGTILEPHFSLEFTSGK
jgi:outer membrane protein TolC